MEDENGDNIVEILFVKAIVQLLKNDEGMIIHHDGKGYAVYKNSVNGTIELCIDEEYLDQEHGQLIWMHYDGSEAPEPAFEEIGVKVGDEYRQLSANQLQIENEYYSSIRPKRVARSGERPTAALHRDGIEYVEVRSLDLNIFDPVGISQNTMRFVEALLIYCLLQDSPPLDQSEIQEAAANQSATATSGRDPELKLSRQGKPVTLKEWASDILQKVGQVAELIDRGSDRDDFAQAVSAQAMIVANPELTPSARILRDLHDTNSGFFHYALDAARNNQNYFASLDVTDDEHLKVFTDEAASSIERQAEIEAADNISLDEYLRHYFSS